MFVMLGVDEIMVDQQRGGTNKWNERRFGEWCIILIEWSRMRMNAVQGAPLFIFYVLSGGLMLLQVSC